MEILSQVASGACGPAAPGGHVKRQVNGFGTPRIPHFLDMVFCEPVTRGQRPQANYFMVGLEMFRCLRCHRGAISWREHERFPLVRGGTGLPSFHGKITVRK